MEKNFSIFSDAFQTLEQVDSGTALSPFTEMHKTQLSTAHSNLP